MFYLPPGQGATDTARWPVPREELLAEAATIFGSAPMQCGDRPKSSPVERLVASVAEDEPPRAETVRLRVGVRRILENSTVCQLSMPMFKNTLLGFFELKFSSHGSLALSGVGVFIKVFDGEFDPGSGRTLAACLTHASRTMMPFGVD